jgi:PKD repeat protein
MTYHVISDAEKAYLRSPGQHSKLYLGFPSPATIFAAVVNQTFTTTDMITEIIYDGEGAYDYTDILPGMTVWIGSAAGLRDLGMCRIRKAAIEHTIYIGETSEIPWAENVHITVKDDFGLWPKHIFRDDEHVVFMDYDIAYDDDQHVDFDPAPVLGPDAVLFYQGTLGGSNTVHTHFDASASWVIDSSISAYSWSAPGASATSGMATATPTITYDAPGTYRVSCLVTAANGKSFTGYRKVLVYDATEPPITQFMLRSCSGDKELGGWEFEVELYDSTELAQVVERGECFLFARDWYGSQVSRTAATIAFDSGTKKITDSGSGLAIFKSGMTIKVTGSTSNDGIYHVVTGNVAGEIVVAESLTTEALGDTVTVEELDGHAEVSIGPITDRENIICHGWISSERLVINKKGGYASFRVEGPHALLDSMEGFMIGFEHNLTPTEWIHFDQPRPDKALWNHLHWRSTATAMMDCILTGDTRVCGAVEASVGSLWQQMVTMCQEYILAKPCTDRYGRLFVQVASEYQPTATRATNHSTAMALTDADFGEEVEVEYQPLNVVNQISLSGMYFDGTDILTGLVAYASLANGHSFKRFGRNETVDRLVLSSQSQANELAGLIMTARNNPYPRIGLSLIQNNRWLDICPQYYVTLIADEDNVPRDLDGLLDGSYNLFVESVGFEYNERTSFLSTYISLKFENKVNGEYADLAVTGDLPKNDGGTPDDFPEYPPYPAFPAFPSFQSSRTYTWILSDPAVGGIPGPHLFDAHKALRISAYCVGGTSVTFNIEKRDTIGSAGVDLMASDLVAPTTGAEELDFVDPLMAADYWLWLDISAKSGSPTKLVVTLATSV